MICISVCLTLLVMLATLHLMSKWKAANAGAFYKWSGMGILLIAAGCLVCQAICCFHRCHKKHEKEDCKEKRCAPMRDCDEQMMHDRIMLHPGMGGSCKDGEGKCMMHEMEDDDDDANVKTTIDSSNGKIIIKKEIKKIK